MYNDNNIGLLQFFQLYSREEDCINHFVQERKQDGIVCKNCTQSTKYYYIKSIKQFRCSVCNKKQGLRANTYMADSNLPLNFWYFTSYMMTNFTKSFSAKEIQRQLNHKRYEPIYLMMHKIRVTMRNRDKLYFLNHHLEADEGFVTTYLSANQKKELVKPIVKIQKNNQGRGSNRKTPILVVAESNYTSNKNKWKPNKAVKFIRMTSLVGTGSSEINFELSNLVNKNNAILTTDSWGGYSKSESVVKSHHKVNANTVLKEAVIDEHLPWVHTIISNFKRNILNAHHAVSNKYLDNYLAEFQYKFNRRMYSDNKFEHIIKAGLGMSWKQAA